MTTLTLLGSTGSIGTQALEVAAGYDVVALAAGGANLRLLAEQVLDHDVPLVAVARGLRHRRQRARRDGADGLAVGTDDHDLVLDLPLAAGAAGGLGLLLVGHAPNPMTRPMVLG